MILQGKPNGTYQDFPTISYIFPLELLEEFFILLLHFLFDNLLRQPQLFKNPFNINKRKKISSKSVLGSGGDGLLILFHIAGRHVVPKQMKI